MATDRQSELWKRLWYIQEPGKHLHFLSAFLFPVAEHLGQEDIGAVRYGLVPDVVPADEEDVFAESFAESELQRTVDRAADMVRFRFVIVLKVLTFQHGIADDDIQSVRQRFPFLKGFPRTATHDDNLVNGFCLEIHHVLFNFIRCPWQVVADAVDTLHFRGVTHTDSCNHGDHDRLFRVRHTMLQSYECEGNELRILLYSKKKRKTIFYFFINAVV